MRFRLKNKSYVLNTKIKLVGKDGANLSIITSDINNPTSNYNLTANTITFCLSPLPAVIGDPEVIVNEYTTSALDFENGLIDKIPTTIWNKEGTADITATNKIFGQNSFETKALGDSLYTNSNIITGGSTPFTVEFYALIKNGGGYQIKSYPLFSKDNNSGGGDQSVGVDKDAGGKIYLYRDATGGGVLGDGTRIAYGKTNLNYNDINKYTITYDGASVRLFVNDKLEAIAGTLNGFKFSNSEPFRFFRTLVPSYASYSRSTYGIIDNINIHDGIATKVRDPDPYEEFLIVDLAFDGENNSTKIVDNGISKETIQSELLFQNDLQDSANENNIWITNELSVLDGNLNVNTYNNIITLNDGLHIATGTVIEFDFTPKSAADSGYGSGVFQIGVQNDFTDGVGIYYWNDGRLLIGANYSNVIYGPIIPVGTSCHVMLKVIQPLMIEYIVDGISYGTLTLNQTINNKKITLGYSNRSWNTFKNATYSNFKVRNNRTWTVNGNAKISTTQPFDGFSSLDCTVNGSYIEATSNFTFDLNDFTINTDVIFTNSIGTWDAICGNFDNSTTGTWSLWRAPDGRVVFSTHPNQFIVSLSTLQPNTIYNIRVVRKDNQLYLYINKKLEALVPYLNVNINAEKAVRIGFNYVANDIFNGYIKNFKIYKGVAIPPKQKITSLINVNISSSSVNSNLTWSTSNASVNIDYFTGYLLNTSGNNAFNFYGSNFTLKYKFKGYGNLLREWNTNLRYILSIDSSGVVSFSFYEVGPTQRTITTNSQTLSSDINELELTRINGYFFIKLNGTPYTVTQTGAPYSGGIYGPTTEGVRLGDTGVTTYSIDIYTEKSEDLDKIQLDFDNNVIDKYGNSTWTNNGVTFDQVNSVRGHSAYFNGNRLTTTANNNLNFENKNYSLSFDIKMMTVNTWNDFIYSGVAGAASGLFYTSTGLIRHRFNGSLYYEFNINLQKSQYYKFNQIRTNSVFVTCINDVIVSTYNSTENMNLNLSNSTVIGSALNGAEYMTGYIDNFKSIKDYKENVIIDKPAVHLPLETNAINTGFTPLTVNSVGNPTYTTIDGKKCINVQNGRYLSINQNNIFNLGENSDFYMEFDFYIYSLSSSFFILCDNPGFDKETRISVSTSGTLAITNRTMNTYISLGVVEINKWVNIKIIRKSKYISSAINDNFIDFNQNIEFNYTNNLYIGASPYYGSGSGYISNFKIFVGTSEIPETYNDKKVLDLDFKPTRKSYLFKDKNNKCVIHPVNINYRDYLDSQYCCTFNGTNQYLQLGKNELLNFGLDDFVIEIDFKTYVLDNHNRMLFNNASTNSSYRAYLAICSTMNSNPNKLEFGITNGSGTYFQVRSDNQIEINTRYKVIIKSENGLISMIIDGVTQTMTLQNTNPVNLNYNSNTYIGRLFSNSTDFLNGTIYSLKVFRNTSDLSLLEDVELLKPENVQGYVENKALNLFWNQAGPYRYFSVYRSTDNINYTLLANNIINKSYIDTSIELETTYYYKVIVYSEYNQKESNVFEITIPDLDSIILNFTKLMEQQDSQNIVINFDNN